LRLHRSHRYDDAKSGDERYHGRMTDGVSPSGGEAMTQPRPLLRNDGGGMCGEQIGQLTGGVSSYHHRLGGD